MRRWQPDVVALCEFRATAPSRILAQGLADLGLRHQLSTADLTDPSLNCLLLASRWPLSVMRDRRAPTEPGRWLLAGVAGPRAVALGAMHVPNRDSGRKWPFLDAVLTLAERWRGGPAVLLGDTNSGRPGIDEQSPAFNAREGAWIESLARAGWQDGFRHLRGRTRAYTWYSPNAGNGFRIDQAFLNPALLPSLVSARYTWGTGSRERRSLSDHAALVLDLR
jgi:exonuclease III